MATPLPPPPPPFNHPKHHIPTTNHLPFTLTRRSLLLSTTLTPLSPPPDTTITDRVYLDFSICPTYFTTTTATSTICDDPKPLGRLVIGLYGHLVPLTVKNFKTMCSTSSYRNTLVHKVLPGQFLVAGHQGSRRSNERLMMNPSMEQLLVRNTESVDPNAFRLKHSRGGVVSLCLGENDDDDDVKLDPGYRNVEFLITTGPGPCPQLDNENIVFGVVMEGLDVVTAIGSVPTYKPSERIRQFNDFAEFLGDERAQNARALWNRPLKTVYISDCGEFKVAKPFLSPPSLP